MGVRDLDHRVQVYVRKCWVKLIGASLSEPHTSVTAFAEVVCMYVCLLAAIYRKF